MSSNLTVFFVLVFALSTAVVLVTSDETVTSCTCGTGTTTIGGACTFFLYTNGSVTNVTGCTCTVAGNALQVVSLGITFGVTCVTPTSTSTVSTTTGTTPSTTTAAATTTEEEDVDSVVVDEEIIEYGFCNNTVLSGNDKKLAKIFFYVGSVWVIIWTFFTFLINIVLKEKGHHRYIGCLEEITIVVVFVFLGFMVWDPFNSLDVCKATGIVLHATMLLVLAFSLMEVNFANSMVKGRSELNGSAPPALNYILPFVLAAIPTAASYLTLKKYYGASGIHCLVIVYTDMLWAWAIPAWILLIVTLFLGQLAFLACIQERDDVNKPQLFWAKKCCKALPLLLVMFLSTYFVAVFALDFQRFWLTILYLVMCIFLGPTIFICHTYCYLNTATKLWKNTEFNVYRPCPEKQEKDKLAEPEDTVPPEDEGQIPPPAEAPQQGAPPPNAGPQSGPPQQPKPGAPKTDPEPTPDATATKSQDFYDWVTNRDTKDIGHSENILFKPHPF